MLESKDLEADEEENEKKNQNSPNSTRKSANFSLSHTPSLVSRATRANSEVDEMDDDFVRQNDVTVKVINFIEKF